MRSVILLFLSHAQIDDIHSRNKLPIVVGGTHYYIQSLLWKNCLIGSTASTDEDINTFYEETLDAPTEILYRRLQEVDPLMATRWHSNDRRKIRRSLEVSISNVHITWK
jgi:tRNA dimethylallyltransferase